MKKLVVILICLLFLSSVVYATGDYKPGPSFYSSETLDNVEHDQNTISKSVNVVAGRSLGSGVRTLIEGSMPMVISKDTSIVEISIRALPTNEKSYIYVGGDANLTSNGFILSDDTEEPLVLRVDNTTDVYLSADIGYTPGNTRGSGVSFIYTVK